MSKYDEELEGLFSYIKNLREDEFKFSGALSDLCKKNIKEILGETLKSAKKFDKYSNEILNKERKTTREDYERWLNNSRNDYIELCSKVRADNIVRKNYVNQISIFNEENENLNRRITELNKMVERRDKWMNDMKAENKVLKDFTYYAIDEIHKWGASYCGYTAQELIDNLSDYLNSNGAKALYQKEVLEVVENE